MGAKEIGIFEGVDAHLGKPWYGLKVHRKDTFTYSANVPTLKPDEIDGVVQKLPVGIGRVGTLKDIRQYNKELLDRSPSVGIVLDGRATGTRDGYLGDMIEASRVVTALRSAEKRVVVVTSNQDLFSGNGDPNTEVYYLPSDSPESRLYPNWQHPALLRHLYSLVGEIPFIFPLNAAMPVLVNITSEGKIANQNIIEKAIDAIRPNGSEEQEEVITPGIWSRRGVHQLQALQVMSYMLGIEEAKNWKDFPSAYLHPDSYAQSVADAVVQEYGCFYAVHRTGDRPLLLHPGVATNGRKMTAKYYPERSWREVVEGVARTETPVRNLTLLKPIDEEQAKMAGRLANYARREGIDTAEVPMEEIEQRFGWSLGTFVAFLNILSQRNGIILGCDSMPAGHAGPAVNIPAVVLGSQGYNPGFYSPPKDALVVMPSLGKHTRNIAPYQVVAALQDISSSEDKGAVA